MSAHIPVIDLFAGPGGLGEGFESLAPTSRHPGFRVALSIECDLWAHKTLELRTFFRQFPKGKVPDAYYRYLDGKMSRDGLFEKFPAQAAAASAIARKATLGDISTDEVDAWIETALGTARSTGRWVLVGGPPCQAYSLVGRARRTREARDKFESDERHYLYKEYLRILRRHQPAAFVMENVKGILSASLGGERIFGKICDDLAAAGYELHSVAGEAARDLASSWQPSAFLVRAEKHGIPQARHRVFIVGIRSDLLLAPGALAMSERTPTVWEAIGDLPAIQSHLSKKMTAKPCSWEKARDRGLAIADRFARGKRAPSRRSVLPKLKAPFEQRWFADRKLRRPANHDARGHMPEDISRYAFLAAVAAGLGTSLTLEGFPKELVPNHKNAKSDNGIVPFADRFRVQLAGKPSSTITSHISKDGHYFIHPKPELARSLTVREAARLQTFPDNYFFEGPRTEQYRQVGNAVPPRLAWQIAGTIAKAFT
jgi:DNA (cytosine-5)-methyltransferase 1